MKQIRLIHDALSAFLVRKTRYIRRSSLRKKKHICAHSIRASSQMSRFAVICCALFQCLSKLEMGFYSAAKRDG